MSKRVFIVLGNGFTIDYINYMKQTDVDAINLFRYGAHVRWPEDARQGFLSYQHCPSLWSLGLRPGVDMSMAMPVMEDILTCANLFAASPEERTRHTSKENSIYLSAYEELAFYLRFLFIHYDAKFNFNDAAMHNWSWAKYFRRLKQDANVNEVLIVTFNYDLVLERVLNAMAMEFEIHPTQVSNNAKFKIVKPHGSISFCSHDKLDGAPFRIPKAFDSVAVPFDRFEIRYEDLGQNFVSTALIPPAGDSQRMNHAWSKQLREKAFEWALKLQPGDDLIISGLSYWHVDRVEIDGMLTRANPAVNVVMVNPRPNRAMEAVLTTLFENYIHLNDTQLVEEIQS